MSVFPRRSVGTRAGSAAVKSQSLLSQGIIRTGQVAEVVYSSNCLNPFLVRASFELSFFTMSGSLLSSQSLLSQGIIRTKPAAEEGTIGPSQSLLSQGIIRTPLDFFNL